MGAVCVKSVVAGAGLAVGTGIAGVTAGGETIAGNAGVTAGAGMGAGTDGAGAGGGDVAAWAERLFR